MSESMILRTYAVRFGDAFLLKVPDRDENGPVVRHILIDVGNSYNGVGGDDAVFKPVLEDIKKELNGRPLDLYIMTHEHMDHVQGLLHAKAKENIELEVNYAWLTASAATNYYDSHPDARKSMELMQKLYPSIEQELTAAPKAYKNAMAGILAINNPRRTADCVDHIRTMAKHPPSFISRGCKLKGTHPFKDVKFEVWAPEEDTSNYYGHFQPMRLDMAPRKTNSGAEPGGPIVPPSGVDAGAFYDLVRMRERGAYDNIMQIDRAKNNTSIVFVLEWRGWRLLFTGDAEERSWRTMDREGVLSPVHFMKVSHHGSHNGTPDSEILDKVLPVPSPDDWTRFAVTSTYENSYPGIPHEPTDSKIEKRCELIKTHKMNDGDYFDIEFEG